jgi:diguanylate cyclase (GGDEF)-like protein/PAS domain S-box-containing protein
MSAGSAAPGIIRKEDGLRARLQAILDAMPVAISWARLDDQHIIFVNKKFTHMFGYVLGDFQTVQDWITKTYVRPEHVERANAMWMHHFGLLRNEPAEIPQVEVDVLCKDGVVKTTLLGGLIVPDLSWAMATFVDITDRKQSENHIQRLALEDPLTGLANRRAFTETLKASISRATRQNSSTALLLIDLDEFKPLNDALGHDQGDIVLQAVAERLKVGVRAGDFVCRLGGDEFGVIVDGIAAPGTAEAVADRIITEVQKPFALQGKSLKLNLSIGISVFPRDGTEEQALYKNADLALYRAKKAGRGRWSR